MFLKMNINRLNKKQKLVIMDITNHQKCVLQKLISFPVPKSNSFCIKHTFVNYEFFNRAGDESSTIKKFCTSCKLIK